MPRHVDLSHDITAGMETYPGLPTPVIGDHLSREAAIEVYGEGNTFHIGLVTMCTNTGTYLDVPFHRYADGHDLTGLALDRVAGVPAVCLDRRGEVTIELTADDLEGLGGPRRPRQDRPRRPVGERRVRARTTPTCRAPRPTRWWPPASPASGSTR